MIWTAGRSAIFVMTLLAVLAPGTRAGEAATPPETKPETTTEPTSPTLGSVNGEPILLEDVERLLGGLHGLVEEQDRSVWDVDRLMFRVVNDHLIAQEARSLEMDQEPRVSHKLASHRDRLIRAMLEVDAIASRAAPTEEEIRELFERQYRRVTLRVLTVYESGEAEQALSEVRDGADLATLARERSVDMYQLRGGLVEDLARIDLTREIADAAFTMDPGTIGGPVRTDLGWSIFRVESFAEADPERFDAVEPTLRNLGYQHKSKILRAELAVSARKHHPVRIDEEVVAAIVPEALPDGRWLPKVDDPMAVVARVGEHGVITAQQYGKALLDRWTGVRNVEAATAAAPIILANLVDEALLLAEAKRRGYADRHETHRNLEAYERQILVPFYLEEVLAPGIEVSREEMEAYYDEHRGQFGKPPRLRLGQITVRTEDEARRIADLLENGADLSWLAREHSIDRFAPTGGNRGWVTVQPGADARSEQLLAAVPGDVLEPFGVPDNWVVFKVLVREEQGNFEFDEVSGNVREAVFAQKFREALDTLVGKLRERSEIEIDEARLASLNLSGSFDESTESEGHGF